MRTCCIAILCSVLAIGLSSCDHKPKDEKKSDKGAVGGAKDGKSAKSTDWTANAGAADPSGKKPAAARPKQPTKPAAKSGGGDVKPPTAADLPKYLEGIEGKGQLMATIETSMGVFHCELYEKRVPMTIANFVGLARGLKPWRHPGTNEVHTNKPYFDGIVFHRVIPNFMIQTGDPLGQGVGGPGYKFGDEIDPAVNKHDKPGILSMANAGPGTNGSQFFITEKPTPHLNKKHTVFGHCKETDLVKQIARVPAARSRPNDPVSIKRIVFSRGK